MLGAQSGPVAAAVCRRHGIPSDVAFGSLTPAQQRNLEQALAVDVERNLRAPLAGITNVARERALYRSGRPAMVAAVVLIRARRDTIPTAARQVAGIDGVAEVYSVSGEWDLIAVVRVPEWEQIAEVVTERIAQIDGLERTETLVAFRVYSKKDLDAAYEMFD